MYQGLSARRRKLLLANRRAVGSIPLLGGRLTTPQTATKLNCVAPPLWGPDGYDKNKDSVNRNLK
jgi:hypothetical protein